MREVPGPNLITQANEVQIPTPNHVTQADEQRVVTPEIIQELGETFVLLDGTSSIPQREDQMEGIETYSSLIRVKIDNVHALPLNIEIAIGKPILPENLVIEDDEENLNHTVDDQERLEVLEHEGYLIHVRICTGISEEEIDELIRRRILTKDGEVFMTRVMQSMAKLAVEIGLPDGGILETLYPVFGGDSRSLFFNLDARIDQDIDVNQITARFVKKRDSAKATFYQSEDEADKSFDF